MNSASRRSIEAPRANFNWLASEKCPDGGHFSCALLALLLALAVGDRHLGRGCPGRWWQRGILGGHRGDGLGRRRRRGLRLLLGLLVGPRGQVPALVVGPGRLRLVIGVL